jgi:hypothetical protein
MPSPTPDQAPIEPTPEEPVRPRLAEIFGEEMDGVLAQAEEHGVLVARVVADHVIEAAFEEAEAALEQANARCDGVEKGTRSMIGALLLASHLANAHLSRVNQQSAEAEAALDEADLEHDRTKATTYAMLGFQMVLAGQLATTREQLAETDQAKIDLINALHGKQYLVGRADAGLLARRLQTEVLDDQIAGKEAYLAELNASIAAAEAAKLAAEGYRWPTGTDADNNNGVLTKERPSPAEDDPYAEIPDGARIVEPAGAIDPRFAGVPDPDATRVIPKIPATVIIPTKQQ